MSLYHGRTRWQLIFAFGLLVLTASFDWASAQPLPDGTGLSRTKRAPDPNASLNYRVGGGSRSATSSLEERKRQAIQEGNDARRAFDYEKAIASYNKARELDPKDARAYYGLGNVYYDVYCYDSAINFYSQALKHNSKYLDAIIQLGYTYVRKDRYDEAGAQFDAALGVNPKNVEAKLGGFYVRAKKGKHQEAIEGINQIIVDKAIGNQDRTSSYMVLGEVHNEQTNWAEGILSFEKATQLNPDLAVAYLKLGLSQLNSASWKFDLPEHEIKMQDREDLVAAARVASDNIRKAIEQKHYDHPNSYIFLSMALATQYNYQGALSKLDTYFAKLKELQSRVSFSSCDFAFNRLYADGYWWKAHVFIRESANESNGQRKIELQNKAIEQLKKAIEVKQDYASAYSQLGTIYLRQQQYEQAIEQYKKALLYQTTDSSKAGIYSVLGQAYRRTGSDDEAIYYLKKSIDFNPKESLNYINMAQIYESKGNLDEAIRLGKEAIAHEQKPSITSQYVLATIYFSKARTTNNDGDYEESIRLLKEVIKINNTFSGAYVSLGNVHKFYKQGAKRDEALANFELARKYDPKNPAIYFSLGDLHASVTHNYDAAIKYLTEAIKLKPDYPLAYWTLAIVYREKKDDSEAIKLFLEGLKYQKDMSAYILLADTYDRQKNYDEATKWLREAVRLEPENHSPYLHLARVHTHQRKNDEAIGYYERAISRLKRDDLANKNLYGCRIMRLRCQYSDALACFEKLSYPLPDQVPYEIGNTYVESGNKQAALVQHQQLVKLKSPLAEELLGQINEMK